MNGRAERDRGGNMICHRHAVARAVVGACMLGSAFAALAQDARPPVQNPAESPGAPALNEPAVSPPPEAFKPGFIDAVGRWLEQGAAKFKSGMQEAQQQFDKLGNQARDSAKETTGTVIGLPSLPMPNARVVTGRERCASVQGGGSNCQAAADTVCRGKGFQGGRSL